MSWLDKSVNIMYTLPADEKVVGAIQEV